ncbi:YcjX family protein [Lentibacter algarum]|uniref:YcjX family protein n=1 Tax=Lentibacter algarum TaxID=576131 RepID=UPI001C07EAE2|nr:YcjX family protein [Lentibacter algarum]MBU2981001.1 YcjX family protein [Lentibacter algarum]
MVISAIADSITRQVENVTDTVSEVFFEPVIRLGVTGLARAGKTVFITSLVANLMDRGRMQGLAASPRIEAAFLQPQPDDTVPRFAFEEHLAALTGPTPHWPNSTRAISELRLSLRVKPSGLLAGFQGARTVHIDIVDYPGEWLLDLGLMDKSYAEWSAEVFERIAEREEAAAYLERAANTQGADKLSEPVAKALADAFTNYLTKARDAGYYDCSPGRFLLPGELAGSPVLTFAPLQPAEAAGRRSLIREMERRYEAYKSRVVTPFFRDHFSKIDRQVVLLDALGAIHKGPAAVEDMRNAMGDILSAFKPGQNAFLSKLFLGKRVEKILFAATKADHLHHTEHAKLTAIVEAMVRGASDKAGFAGADTRALALASLRATVEDTLSHEGSKLPCVKGSLLSTGKQAAFYAGELPSDPAKLLVPARERAQVWLDADYQTMEFAPAVLDLKPGDGPPHIRLDRAAEFLLGDKL